MRFRRKRGVKRSVFAENAEWNGVFSAITRYLRISSYILGFNTYLNYIFEILGLGLVYYWMMPKNCEKRTIKSRACVPLSWPGAETSTFRLQLRLRQNFRLLAAPAPQHCKKVHPEQFKVNLRLKVKKLGDKLHLKGAPHHLPIW